MNLKISNYSNTYLKFDEKLRAMLIKFKNTKNKYSVITNNLN